MRVFDQLLETRAKEKTSNGGGLLAVVSNSANLALRYSKLKYREFSVESNVYDMESHKSENVPNNINSYWAITLDLIR